VSGDPLKTIADLAASVPLVPVLATDDSHDIINQARTHTATLDEMAAAGMHPLPPAGPTASDARALHDVNAALAGDTPPPAVPVVDPLQSIHDLAAAFGGGP